MSEHPHTWHGPSPLWDRLLDLGGSALMRRPAVLRFAGDDFMEQLQAVLDGAPEQLAGLLARDESWSAPAAGLDGLSDIELEPPVKLYQPVHERFYLVAASLVCQVRGLPDRKVRPGAGDRLSFVVRRLRPSSPRTVGAGDPEQAWVGDREGGEWRDLADPTTALDGEERLPLFPLSFRFEDRPRRLWAGFLPVAGRELYAGEAAEDPVFVLRCVYERRACRGVHGPKVSAPSRPVRFATYFDPQAPVREVKVRLPQLGEQALDAFRKGAAFLAAPDTHRKLARFRFADSEPADEIDMTDLDGSSGPDPGQLQLGFVWKFSIPIITICAFVLLQIMVQLLNFVFQWLPFFKVLVVLPRSDP
ncbi:MAG: hypothetical protein MI919_08355 [Holophagales bacterium]|nr:hypothetical protein [Holophagales bacterium]